MAIDLDVRRYVSFSELADMPADEGRELRQVLAGTDWFQNFDAARYERRSTSTLPARSSWWSPPSEEALAAKEEKEAEFRRWKALKLASRPELSADAIVNAAEKFLKFVEQRGED